MLLLVFAITLLLNNHICDDQTCKAFTNAFKQPSRKKRLLVILDDLGEDGLLSYAIIISLIICGLLFCILPIPLNITLFILVFVLSIMIFYCIMAFFIYHYVKPIKKYIIRYIENNIDD